MPALKGEDPTFSEVARLFDKPIAEAQQQLGLCGARIKQIIRDNGVARWPFRKYQALVTKGVVSSVDEFLYGPGGLLSDDGQAADGKGVLSALGHHQSAKEKQRDLDQAKERARLKRSAEQAAAAAAGANTFAAAGEQADAAPGYAPPPTKVSRLDYTSPLAAADPPDAAPLTPEELAAPAPAQAAGDKPVPPPAPPATLRAVGRAAGAAAAECVRSGWLVAAAAEAAKRPKPVSVMPLL